MQRKIVCSTNMPYVEEAFSTLGDARVLEGRSICAADVRDAEILALRSTTKVNADLLEGSSVRFVGTATIGTDHLDIPYLEKHGIEWCYSPGCNANSVSEYLVAGLLTLAVRNGFTLRGKTLGVIGVGNVGRRVVEKGRALGMRVLQNDPPRARAGDYSAGEVSPFVELPELLAESDIVTLHVPLNRDGVDRTLRLVDAEFLAKMRKGAILVNAARGGIVDSDALLEALQSAQLAHVVLDTWEGEPDYRLDVMNAVDIATPHIAGHSFEGRVAGTVMVYQAACRYLGIDADWTPDNLLPPPEVPYIDCPAGAIAESELLHSIVKRVYDIEADDRRFRATAESDGGGRAKAFDRLRREYPVRREFRFTKVRLGCAGAGIAATLKALGFGLVE